MEHILFLGGLFPKEKEEDIVKNSRGAVQLAANNLQWKIIGGIEKNLTRPIDIINLMFLGSFPKRFKKWRIPSFRFSHGEDTSDYNVGYLNISMIKQLLLNICQHGPIIKWVRSHKGSKTVLVYSAAHYYMRLIAWMKRKFPDIHIHLIIPDLPAYMNTGKSSNVLKTMLTKYQNAVCKKNLRFADSFTLLTEYMAGYLGISDKPYAVIEGMVDIGPEENALVPEDDRLKKIVYTGSLTYKYGIMDLVSSFEKIPGDDYRLVICGEGEAKTDILKSAEKDRRIEFMGVVSPDQAIKVQRAATVLVNPRKNNEIYTRYSFPSKILEYMAAGKPVLCYRLEGMPTEYEDYLIFLDSDDTDYVAHKLREICQWPPEVRAAYGNAARAFVSSHKNAVCQTEKLLKVLVASSGFIASRRGVSEASHA